MTIKEILAPDKKKLLILAAILIVISILAVWLNFQYIAALDNKLNNFRNDTRSEVLDLSTELAKSDPLKMSDTSAALNKLKELNDKLSERAGYVPGGFRPLLIKTGAYQESEQKLKDYQKNLNETGKILTKTITLSKYLTQIQPVFEPVIKLNASANAVNAQKQIDTWQKALEKLRNVKPDGLFAQRHEDLVKLLEKNISHTKSVLSAQTKKDVNGFTAAHTELVKSYDALNKSSETLRSELRLNQKLLSQSSKKLF